MPRFLRLGNRMIHVPSVTSVTIGTNEVESILEKIPLTDTEQKKVSVNVETNSGKEFVEIAEKNSE